MPDLIRTIIPTLEAVPNNQTSKTESGSITELAPAPNPIAAAPQDNTTKATKPPTKEPLLNTSSIVNKTKEPEILHPVDANADTLTTLADKEEEEFIREVIKEHQDASK